jgi:hypothetical protein
VSDLLYFPPTTGEVLQGDIYQVAPSVLVRTSPVRAARFWREKGGRQEYVVHSDDTPPNGGFKWSMEGGGEDATLVHGFLGLAMVLSHDCEIENDPNVRTLAMIRPVSHLGPHQAAALFANDPGHVQYAIFPLEAQDEAPRMERSFVDFRRLTTVRPEVLDDDQRLASLSDELRRAIARAFWMYLFRRIDEGSR